jgi:predicted acetyltransferase
MQPDIDSLRPGDEGARDELARLAFGRTAPVDPARPTPTLDQLLGAYAGDRLVGTVTMFDEAQWFGGAPVPCGAVASVCVAPDARGERLGQRMMTEALQRMHARGDAITALYPTTATLYRQVGYEVAGWWAITDVPVAAIATRGAGESTVTVRPGSYEDLDAAYDRAAPANNGWLQRSERFRATAQFDFQHSTEAKAIYRAERDGALVGAIAYRAVRDGAGRVFDVATSQLAATDRAALRSLLRLVAAHGTMAECLRTTLPGDLLVPVVDQAQLLRRRAQFPWMLRFVDVGRAIAARGYPEGLEFEVQLDLGGDTELPHNNGRFVLQVRGGKGELSSGGRGTRPVHLAELAMAYSGLDAVHAELRLAFAGRPPTLVDFF